MPDGLLGDGELRPGKYNMALVRRAIKNGWNVPEAVKNALVTQMAKVMLQSEDERNRIAASKVLVAADSNDIRVELADKDTSTTINVNTAVQVNNVLDPTTNERRTAEALALLDAARARAISAASPTPPDEVYHPQTDSPSNGIPESGLP